MIRFIKLIPVFLLTLLLITCSQEDIVEPNGAGKLISSNDGTEATEVYRPLEANVLDFDALIREVEAEVSLYEDSDADGYWSRSQDKIDKEAELLKEYNTERQWIIDKIEEKKKAGWLRSDNRNIGGKLWETPDYFNTPAKRANVVDARINSVYGVFQLLYKLEFLKYKYKQLDELLYSTKWRNDGSSYRVGKYKATDYDCKDIAIIKKINKFKDRQWKSFGTLGLFGTENPYGKKRITKGDGELTDLRQLKLKLRAVRYIKNLVNGATFRSTSMWDYKTRKWLGWRIVYANADSDNYRHGIKYDDNGDIVYRWYDGMDWQDIFRGVSWRGWFNSCQYITDSKYPVENCQDPYFRWLRLKHYNVIRYSDFENRKEECN